MRLVLVSVCVATLGLVFACGSSDANDGGASNAGGSAGQPNAGSGSGARSGAGGSATNGSAGRASSAGNGGSVSNGGNATNGGSDGSAAGDGNAGAAGDGGDQTVNICTGDPIDLIDLTKTMFMDYGKLRVGFKQAVDATTLVVQLNPAGKLTATAIAQVDPTTVDVTLGYYHLPRDYQIQIASMVNGEQKYCGEATIPGDNNGARLGFLSKTTGPGDFTSWPGAANTASARDDADAVCQREAETAGFKGKFVAFLSAHGAYDAGCRALGLDGTLATNCGQSALPTDLAPFLNPFGLPMVDGATNIIAGNWNAAMSYRADGVNTIYQFTWTGTVNGAVASDSTGGDCSGWTSLVGEALSFPFTSTGLPSYGEGLNDCNPMTNAYPAGFMCLQVGGTFFGPNTLHQLHGKRAFVSKGTLTGAMSFGGKTGIAAADALCQSEATGANLANATNFRAYLGTLATEPLCHVLGKQGKAADNCGLSTLPSDVWSRVDGFPIGSASDLSQNQLIAPLTLAADGSQQFAAVPWTAADTSNSEKTCEDWTSNSQTETAEAGSTTNTNYGWSQAAGPNCGSAQPLYCFEQ